MTLPDIILAAELSLKNPSCANAFGPDHTLTSVSHMTFVDDFESGVCKSDRVSMWLLKDETVIHVCKLFYSKSVKKQIAIVIHEGFHTVGVEEHSNTDSQKITDRVMEMCK